MNNRSLFRDFIAKNYGQALKSSFSAILSQSEIELPVKLDRVTKENR